MGAGDPVGESVGSGGSVRRGVGFGVGTGVGRKGVAEGLALLCGSIPPSTPLELPDPEATGEGEVVAPLVACTRWTRSSLMPAQPIAAESPHMAIAPVSRNPTPGLASRRARDPVFRPTRASYPPCPPVFPAETPAWGNVPCRKGAPRSPGPPRPQPDPPRFATMWFERIQHQALGLPKAITHTQGQGKRTAPNRCRTQVVGRAMPKEAGPLFAKEAGFQEKDQEVT